MTLLELFQKIDVERIFSNSFCEARITVIPSQRCHKKRKPQASIFDEYSCKNPQLNTNNMNSTTHQKQYTPWSNGIYPWDARLFQHTPHKSMWYSTLTEWMIKKTCDHLNRYPKSNWQNSTSIHDKISQSNRYKRKFLPYNKGHSWKAAHN